MTHSARNPDHEVHPLFTNRWSPRSYTGESIDDATLFSLFEAARWAPSGNNSQPWRFIYAHRDSAHWQDFLSVLAERNRLWAVNSAVLILLVSKTTHLRQGETTVSPLRNHVLDAGAAWLSLALQAEHLGWKSHAIGGFDRDAAKLRARIPDDYHVNLMIAVGRQGHADELPEDLRARETPTSRRPIRELVAEGEFSFPS